jgi:putative copper export protein
VISHHRAALACVAIVLLTGLAAAWLRLTSIDDLWTTPYGNLLFRKTIFVMGVLLFGLYHWLFVALPQWSDKTGLRFTRSAAFELMAGAIVVAFTALLIATALPT